MGLALGDELLADFFGNAEQRAIFDAERRLQSWLDVEAALAQVQAELGVIPAEAARRIADCCRAEQFDLHSLGNQIAVTQHPIVPVVHAIEEAVGPQWARYVHFGATTQDIMDTGQALQLRSGLAAVQRDVVTAVDRARDLALGHRGTPQAGRTHGQHAVPITFGLKAATWFDELSRTAARITEATPRILTAQVFGAAGTMAAYGPRAFDTSAALTERLGLTPAAVPWHATRDRIAELASVVAFLSAAAERIAAEVIRLQSTEFGEVTEPLQPGHIGSSTMPQKRNPHLSESIVAKARLAGGLAATLSRNGAHQHERDMAAWAVEWLAVPELMVLAGGLAADLVTLLDGLTVRAERMTSNLALTGGQVSAESLMMRLADAIGRDSAHHLLVELTRTADRDGLPFAEVAAADPRVAAHLGAEHVTAALDPAGYIGHSAAIVERAAAAATRTSKTSTPSSSRRKS